MTIDLKNYHPEWEEISAWIRRRAENACELCPAQNGQAHWKTGSIVILTVHHIDGNPRNNHARNLLALCQRCHLRLDEGLRTAKMKRSRADLFWKGGGI